MTRERFQSYGRRRQHWVIDRTKTLASQGKTDEEIASEIGLPLINVRSLTKPIRKQQAADMMRRGIGNVEIYQATGIDLTEADDE